VQAGEPVTVTWKTENAGEVSVAPFGAVAANGAQTVNPTETTTYKLTAKGPGGVQESSVTVTVASAAAEPPELQEVDLEEARGGRLDVLFDYDDFSIRSDQLGTIKNDADFLKQHPEIYIRVEGHCDETGSTEYNLALGERRAWEVKFALEKAGISAGRMEAITLGKEQPFCEEQSDECWQRNRRAHIVVQVAR
jgi:peptidoglycan-associated lipoprotein